MPATELDELKREERAMWARGDYGEIARDMFWDVGARIVERLRIRPGQRVLDVACGTGNAALRAAEAGADVVGLDLTPELLARGAELAAEAGVAVDWVEGDAEAIPFEAESFDVVVSTFGCMFAPRHDVTAGELARVLRPGGRLGVCSWTPQSALSDMMRALMAHLPPGPGSGPPPSLWGDEDHVRELFAGTGIELELGREVVEFRFASIDAALDRYGMTWGPFIEAREALEPDGRWPALREDLARVLERHDTSGGAGLAYPGEYLVVAGRRRG